jgi:hypothetical protein
VPLNFNSFVGDFDLNKIKLFIHSYIYEHWTYNIFTCLSFEIIIHNIHISGP